MKKLLSILVLAYSYAGHSQVVSRFTWDTNPLTHAAIGPDGTSINGTAYQALVPSPVNYAINPGTPTKDIDLVVPGSLYFDIPGIDIDLYFRKEESEASFFKRGSLFNFGMNNGQLYVTFTTNKGSNPGTITVNSGYVATVIDDHKFHHYRFKYDNNTGSGNLYIDDVVVYTYNGVAGYTLNWTGAGNVIIGEKMDATGRNLPVLGNMTIANPAIAASLPASLLSFETSATKSAVVVEWTTTREINVKNFMVESSADGKQFKAVKSVLPAGGYDLTNRYRVTDHITAYGMMYYRLKTIDNDGKSAYSDVRKVTIGSLATTIACFPNPVIDYVTLSMDNIKAGKFTYFVMTAGGNMIRSADVQLGNGAQQIRIDLNRTTPTGTLIIRLVNTQQNITESYKVIKG